MYVHTYIHTYIHTNVHTDIFISSSLTTEQNHAFHTTHTFFYRCIIFLQPVQRVINLHRFLTISLQFHSFFTH